MTYARTARICAWFLFVAIVVVSLGPIEVRPVTHFPVNLERSAAFLILGATFALAYPQRIGLAALFVLICAIGLEVLQNVQPGRHGRELDALAKIGGALVGLCCGLLVDRAMKKIWSRDQ